MKKILLIDILLLLFLGCDKKGNDNIISLYYFKSLTTTPIQVSCNTIFGYYGLRKIEIVNIEESTILHELIGSLNNAKVQEDIDVRYKLTYLKDSLCLDVFGGVVYNGNRMADSPETLFFLKKLIEKYKHKALKKEGEFEFPEIEKEATP